MPELQLKKIRFPELHLPEMSRDDISKELFLLVRQLEPTETGLPLEIYGFTTETGWAAYEGIQGDIFDHLIAILPEFGLRLFQQPTGLDMSAAMSCDRSSG